VDWVPLGRFVRKYSALSNMLFRGQPIGKIIEAEIAQDGKEWPPLHAGLFGGSLERLQAAKQRVDSSITVASHW
jgi:hypothetical protein